MLKRSAITVVLVFLLWSGMDFLIHGVLLGSIYEATANLWRPMDQMNQPMMNFVSLASAIGFVAIYALLVTQKSLSSGIKLGVLYGLAVAIPMGFGSYSYMPIPIELAWGWFLAGLSKMVVAGAIAGAVIKS